MSPKPTHLEIPLQSLAFITPDLIPDLGKHVVPMCVEHRRKPQVVGTGFLVAVNERHFLITAAHVLDKLEDNLPYFFPSGPHTTRLVAGDVIKSVVPEGRTRDDDKLDVGVVVLSGDNLPPYPGFLTEAMEIERVAAWVTDRTSANYAISGFAASQGKPNPVTRKFAPLMNVHLTSSISAERYLQLGLDLHTHIAMAFDKKANFDTSGKRIDFPHPSGMSGSPVWQLYGPRPEDRKVVGMFIEYRARENVFIATDIGVAVDFIRHVFEKISR